MKEDEKLRKFLTDAGRKGYLDTLKIIQKNDGIHHNEILKELLDKKILKGTSYVNTILNLLTEAKMIKKHADTTVRPMRTEYTITENGIEILKTIKTLTGNIKNIL